jgi:hypothetical protein
MTSVAAAAIASRKLTSHQTKEILGVTHADIESVEFCNDPFVVVIVAGNGRDPRTMTVWEIPDDCAVPKLVTGIGIPLDVRAGFYCGEMRFDETLVRVAFAVTGMRLVPYYEVDRTSGGKAVERWRSSESKSIYGEITRVEIENLAENRILVTAGGRYYSFLCQFTGSELMLR